MVQRVPSVRRSAVHCRERFRQSVTADRPDRPDRPDRIRVWTLSELWLRPDRSLTVAAVTILVGGALFALITLDVLGHGGVTRADPRLLHDVVAGRQPWLTPIARVVTEFGTGPMVYGVLAVTGVMLWYRTRDWRPPVLAVVVLALGQTARLTVNQWVARPRPPRPLWLVHPSGYSYPSGHTTTATIGYGLAAALIARTWPSARVPGFAAAAVMAIAVGLSRIYLGVHWPSDVVGGWVSGVAWLALAAGAVTLYRRRPGAPGRGPSIEL